MKFLPKKYKCNGCDKEQYTDAHCYGCGGVSFDNLPRQNLQTPVYSCLRCDHLFKVWNEVEFNKKEVCPICGIARDLRQYELIRSN